MKLAVLTLIPLVLVGCGRRELSQNPVTGMGLRETALGRQFVEDSITTTNLILARDGNVELIPSWKPTSPQRSSRVATVHLIDSSAVAPPYMIFVPNECRCILVDPLAVRKWLKDRSEAKPEMLQVSNPNALSFMFLHEVGHIVHNDPGQFEEARRGVLNTSETDQKRRETAADRFAVNQLQVAIANPKNTNAWLAAQNISVDLTNLAYNISELRMVDGFGGTVLASPTAFADVGYTHPNFELRLLTANNMLADSETSKKLLHDFIQSRSTGTTWSGVLLHR